MSEDSNPVRWARAKAIFDQLLETPEPERAPRFAALCQGDTALEAEVSSLLEAHRDAGDFLSRGAEGLPPNALPSNALPADPERFGPYRRLSELGRGGMGTVYLGERVDGDFAQRVAIKLIRRGLDTDAVLARFLAERRILASLDHPGIARLLDGGATQDGRPYFVLEAIEGDPLDVHCSKQRLSIEQRLRLFLEVCDAVAYAHRRLILHRDLKPGNILVDAHGKAKLLDFGIAKLLSPDLVAEATALTLVGPLAGAGPKAGPLIGPMTPEYASPEQLRGEALTTASDVYSLGVVLRQLIAEVKPARRGDLDEVIDHALTEEPSRRYATVEAFADDLTRYLQGQPVTAHPPSLGYRLSTFVRRHRAASISAGLLLVTLSAGVGTTLQQARRAERARALAQDRFDELRGLARAFLFDVNDGVEDLAGSTPVREKIVATALTYLDRLAEGETGDRELALEIGEGYRRIGDVQGNPQLPNLGNLAGAARSYAKAADLARAQAGRDPGDLEARLLLATVLLRQADVELHSAGLENAKRALDEADGPIAEVLAIQPRAITARRLRAQVASRRARIERNAGNYEVALRWAGAARDEIATLATTSPADPEIERDRLITETDWGYTLGAAERWEEAAAVLRPALATAERRAAAAPNDFAARRDLSVALERLGKVLNQLGRTDEALPLLRRIVAMDEAHLALDPRNTQALHDVAASHDQLAQALWAAGDLQEAIAVFTRADEVLIRLLAVEPNLRSAEVDRAGVIGRRAQIRQEGGNLQGALADMVQALALQQAAADAEPTHSGLRYDLAVMRANTAEWLLAAGRGADADASIRQALEQFAAYRAQVPDDTGAVLGSAVSQALRGDIAWRSRRFDEACAAFAEAEREWRLYLGPAAVAPDEALAAEHRKTTQGLARCPRPASSAQAPPEPATTIEIPFTFATRQPIVPVRIDGGEAVPFVVDTGASIHVVDPGVLPSSRSNPPSSASAGRTLSGGGEGRVPARAVDGLTFAIEAFSWRAQRATAIDLGYPHRKHFAGLLGAPLLTRYVVEFDFDRLILRLHDPASFRPPPGTVRLPFELVEDLPIVHVTLDAGKGPIDARLLIDTAAATFIDLNRPFVERHGLVEALADVATADRPAAIGSPAPFLYGTARSVVFAGETFDHPRLGLSRATSGSSASTARDGILGNDVLRHFTVTVDYPRRVLWLERNSTRHGKAG